MQRVQTKIVALNVRNGGGARTAEVCAFLERIDAEAVVLLEFGTLYSGVSSGDDRRGRR